MRPYRLLFGLLVAAVGGGQASADPIWFTYRVDGYTTQSDAGDFTIQAVSSGPVSLDTGTNPSLVLATVRLGTRTTNNPAVSDGSGPDMLSRFSVKLQVTDATTGEVGVVRLTGWADFRSNRNDGGDATLDGTTIGFDSDKEDLTVGSRTYAILATGDHGPNSDDVTGTLSIRVVTAVQTPEPGTLVLAGLGLASIAGKRFRRKKQG
ncbi:MAG TPA: PEP-CTERM sorting domain-containing protein [Fimbriiglobus sp.]|jgi:hypothetical protein